MISLLLLAGCVPAVWIQEKGQHTMASLNFSVIMPEGWMKLNTGDVLRVTRDGLLLQEIRIGRVEIGLPFQFTKKKLAKGMLPQEVADVFLDNITSNQAFQNFELKENVPATVDGHAGFKITYCFKSEDGVRLKVVDYGFLSGDWLYVLHYDAPERHYFDKDIKTFEQFVTSFRLIKA